MSVEYVLVDFDGTMTTRDTVRYLLVELLRLRPWKAFHLAKLIDFNAARGSHCFQVRKSRCIGSLIDGLDDHDLSVAITRYHAKVRPKFRAGMKLVIADALSEGRGVLIVTASPQFAVEGFFDQVGVRCIGTRYKKNGAKYESVCDGEICYGLAKVDAIHSALRDLSGNVDFIAAWSDSLSDLPMMKLARDRFWIYGGNDPAEFQLADPGATFVSGQSLS